MAGSAPLRHNIQNKNPSEFLTAQSEIDQTYSKQGLLGNPLYI